MNEQLVLYFALYFIFSLLVGSISTAILASYKLFGRLKPLGWVVYILTGLFGILFYVLFDKFMDLVIFIVISIFQKFLIEGEKK